jgi:hypothetical protein
MEGKLTHVKTLLRDETEKIFRMMLETNDIFISVEKSDG